MGEKKARIEAAPTTAVAANPLNNIFADSLAYYQALLLQSNFALKLNLLGAPSAFQQPYTATPSTAKTIDAAAGLLALSNGLAAQPGIIK